MIPKVGADFRKKSMFQLKQLKKVYFRTLP